MLQVDKIVTQTLIINIFKHPFKYEKYLSCGLENSTVVILMHNFEERMFQTLFFWGIDRT